MKKTLERLMSGATRLLVLALGLGLTTTGWAVAPTPTAVWQSGEFGQTKNGYSVTLNGNVINADGDIVIGSSKGIKIVTNSSGGAAAVSVLLKYKTAPSRSKGCAFSSFIKSDGTTGYDSVEVGMTIGNATSKLKRYYAKAGVNYGSADNANAPVLSTSGGVALFSYDKITVKCYGGSSVSTMSGYTDGHNWNSHRMIDCVGIGGGTGGINCTDSNYPPTWEGLVVEKVAIFVGNAYTNEELADYVFPTAGRYANWEYAENRVFTWKSVFSVSSGTDVIANNGATYDVFDVAVGTDSGTTKSNGTDANSLVYWQRFCFGQTPYNAPGYVLRLAGDYYKEVHGKFSPMTIGGLIVEPGATGYSFPSEGNRSAAFGDPTGNVETWFDINEDFTVARTGGVAFMGTVNLDVAYGKTLTIVKAKLMQEAESVSSAPQLPNAKVSGGVLKMHGEGQLSVTSDALTATDATLDYSDLGKRVNTNPFISGTIAINEGTTFVLPEGATSPYKVATAISGTYPTSITIGDKTYAASVSAGENAGEIAWEINEYTIDAAGDYVLSTIFPTPASAKDYSLIVEQDATLDVGSTTVRAITIDVAEGKTLTLSGTSLTATTIYVTGKGTVKVTADGALQGTLKGDGTVMYSGVLPASSGVTLNDSAWTGTVWIYNFGSINSTVQSNLGTEMPNWGNAKSKVKFTLVKAFAPNANITCPYTLVLEDGASASDYAWRCDNGFGSATATFGALSGSGTFYDHGSVASKFTFNSFAGFTGTFDITSGGHQIVIPSTAALTITKDASIRFADRGLSGSVTIESGKTLTVYGGDGLNYDGSGMVNIYGTMAMGDTRWTLGPSNFINIHEGGQITGNGPANGNLDMNKAGATKTIHAYGNATISATISARQDDNCQIIVDEGKTLTVSGRIFGSCKIYKRGLGTLKLSYIGSEAVIEPTLEEGYVEFADTYEHNLGSMRDLTGYKVSNGSVVRLNQTQVEYGVGEMVVTGVDSSVTEIRITRYDTTQATVTPAAGQATLTEDSVVSGKACWHAYEMNKFTGSGNGSRIVDDGSGNVQLQLYSDSFTDDNFIQEGETDNWYLNYGEKQPYPTSGYSLGTEWTAAIRCTVPTAHKGIVVAFGTKGEGLIGLAAGENAGEVIIVRTTGNSAYTKLATMTVAHPTEAQHVYVFTKTADAVTVYCDGDFINRTPVSFTSPSNFQIGSVHGSTGNTGLVAANNGEMDYLRIYNFAITPKMIAKLAADNPYVSPSGTYTRTVTGNADWVDDGAWTVNYTASTIDAPASDAVAMLTANAASTMTVNLSDAALYEELVFDGSASVRLEAGEGTAKLSAVKVGVETDVTVKYGAADFSTTRVSVADGKTLTFDFSAEPINSQTERRIVYLTGVAAEPADLSDSSTWPVQVTTHADAASLDAGFLSRFEYDTASSRYVYTYGPNHTVGGEVYYTGGYWSSDVNNTISVTNSYGEATIIFSGDTVVIPSYYPGDTPTIYSDSTLPANVSKIRLSKSKIKMCSGVDSGDIFTGVTWTIDSGCTLWFGVGGNHPNSLGVMTINGPGTVECGNITINGTMSGDAPVKILDNVTTRLTSTGSIATDHTISGGSSATITVAKTTPITERMAFGTWTGTVVLPENFNANSDGVDLHYYGKAGSTIEINGFTGWLTTGETYSGAGTYGRQINPHLKLNGNMSITGLSAAWYDIIGGISGSGNFSLSSSNKPNGDSFWITKVSGYTGSIINNTTGSAETTIVIKELVADTFVGGTKILSRGGAGPLSVSKVTFADTEQSLSDLCYESDGVYVAAAEYNSEKYYSVAAAIAVAGDANLADITLLNGCTTVPAGYYFNDGAVVKCPAAIVYAAGDPDYYNNVQAAVNAANGKTYAGDSYEYVAVYANAAVTTARTLKIKPMNEAVVTVSVPSITSEYALNDETDENGVVTYTIDPASTDYTWVAASGVWDTTAVAPWRYDVESTPTQATRAPTGVDSVAFASAADVTVGENMSVSSMTVSSSITLSKVSADVTVAATTGGIVLTDVGASITVSGVTLSPTPTTTVANSYAKLTGSTYSVDAYNVITISAPNATVTRTDALVTAIKDGDTITFTVAADSGYVVSGVTANGVAVVPDADVYSVTVTENTTIAVATVQNASITGVTFDYYASYTNADVTAKVGGAGTYTLSVQGKDYVANAVGAGTITFENVDVSNTELGSGVAYTITATGAATGGTSGTSDQKKGTVVDGSGWMLYNKTATGVGTWTDGNDAPVTPDYGGNDYVAFSGTNTYTAAWMSTGEVVTVTTNVKFGDVADSDITPDTDAQAAVRIGAGNVFQVYAGSTPDWVNVYNDELGAPDGNVQYGVTVKLNYTTQAYGVDITKEAATYPLTNATGGAAFPLAKAASAMQQVSYLGAGSFISLSGEYVSAGYTADVGTAGSATNVVVSSDFVNTYMSDKLASEISDLLDPNATKETKPNAIAANGYNYFTSYALGLDPTEKDDKVIVDVTTDDSGKFVFTVKHPVFDGAGNITGYEEVTEAANVTTTVTLKYGTSTGSIETVETGSTEGISPVDMFNHEGVGNVLYYKAEVTIGAK